MVLQDGYCDNCGREYTTMRYKWCKPCQLDYFKENFTDLTSGNKKIDKLIKTKQLEIFHYNDIVFEWIPYNQFDDIEEIGQGGFSTVYSAIWKDGPLGYDQDKIKYTRSQNKKVALKCLHNSQNITNEFLNEVWS